MSYLNIAGYQFTALDQLEKLKLLLQQNCSSLDLKGTILLSSEGININLAGLPADITQFITELKAFSFFAAITFRESYSDTQPFKRLKIKIKKEIITFRQAQIDPTKEQAKKIDPLVLKQWLDEKKDLLLLDTRNTFEVGYGTFEVAKHLEIDNFCEFPEAIDKVSAQQPVVMFCTGGIRCEKAALYLLEKGYSDVYQLDGGILNYFKTVGKAHYQGECFVFDERITVSPDDFQGEV